MKERPIIFSTEMVKAILEGRKTMTRRVIKPQPKHEWLSYMAVDGGALQNGPDYPDGDDDFVSCPYGEPGDRLWVRERWFSDEEDLEYARAIHEDIMRSPKPIFYEASEKNPDIFPNWRPSIYMPKWAARVWLEVTGVRVERLQEIDSFDVIEEGFLDVVREGFLHTVAFIETWNKLNAKRGYSWESNPWVWVIEFKRTEP